MDQQKDNKIHGDNKGQTSKMAQISSGFSPEQRSAYIVRKAEKLTTALYMVSDIIPDKEPVKWKMRETSIELLSDITLSGTASSSDRISYLRNVVKRAEKMVSFLEIAWATRMLSEMNASILRDEFLTLRSLVEEDVAKLLVGNLGETGIPPRPDVSSVPSVLSVSPKQSAVAGVPNIIESAATPHVTRIATGVSAPQYSSHPLPSRGAHIAPVRTQEESKKSEIQKMVSVPAQPPEVLSQTKLTRPTEGEKVGKEDRRKIILALLKQRSNLTVRDISKSIPGFSEKTIQRELVAMLGDGQVRKDGEKRWTTYSLV